MTYSKIIAALGVTGAIGVMLAGCSGNNAPEASSDSKQSYDGSTVPVDDNVYHVTGEVVGQVNSLTRQVKPAQGSLSGSQYGGYGSVSGSFTGPVEGGKGFVRIRVEKSDVDLAPVSNVAILKTTDTKVTALQPGDVVTFVCRKQYEAIAAVRDNSSFDKNKLATWELDYCRLATPVVEVR